MDQFEFGGEVAWRPTPEYIERSRLTAFIRKHGLRDYAELMHRSTTDLEWFWRAVLDDLGIEFYEPYRAILDTSRGIARTAVVRRRTHEHRPQLPRQVDGHADRAPGRRALGRRRRRDADADLSASCARTSIAARTACAAWASAAAIASRCSCRCAPSSIAAFFAVITIGGIVLPLFSGYGADAVASRLQDSGAKALITADGFWRRGQIVRDEGDRRSGGRRSRRRCSTWSSCSRLGVETIDDRPRLPLVGSRRLGVRTPCDRCTTDADEPMMIIYTSGTTGRPKGAVHTHCGFPIKTAQDMVHCFDVQPGETMYWVSDMGWMMGPWEVLGMTLLGGTMVLYDGALDYPGPDRLWAIVERHRVNILGVSPTLDPLADAPRRGSGSPPRSLVAAHPRLDRRAVESRTVAMVLRRRRRRQAADHQLLGRHRSLRRTGRRQRAHAAQACGVRRAAAGYRRRRRGRSRAGRCATRSASWSFGSRGSA